MALSVSGSGRMFVEASSNRSLCLAYIGACAGVVVGAGTRDVVDKAKGFGLFQLVFGFDESLSDGATGPN